jgi:hypothetical protein
MEDFRAAKAVDAEAGDGRERVCDVRGTGRVGGILANCVQRNTNIINIVTAFSHP